MSYTQTFGCLWRVVVLLSIHTYPLYSVVFQCHCLLSYIVVTVCYDWYTVAVHPSDMSKRLYVGATRASADSLNLTVRFVSICLHWFVV